MFRMILSILLVVSISATALAQTEAAAEGSQQGYTYDGMLTKGHAQYMARNYAQAISEYEQAKAADPGKSDAYYFIGCAMAKQDRYAEAVTVLKSAATVAGEANVNWQGKALFVIATIWERAGDLAQAKYAWTEYLNFANGHPDAAVHINLADKRIKAIEQWEKLNSEYQIVRDRIANGAQ